MGGIEREVSSGGGGGARADDGGGNVRMRVRGTIDDANA